MENNSNYYVDHNFEFRLHDILHNKISVSEGYEKHSVQVQIPKIQQLRQIQKIQVFWTDSKDTTILGRSQKIQQFWADSKRYNNSEQIPKDTTILVRSERYNNSGQIPKDTTILGSSKKIQ